MMADRWFIVTEVRSIPAVFFVKGWSKKEFAKACPAWTMSLWKILGYLKTEIYYLRHFNEYDESISIIINTIRKIWAKP